MNRRILPALLIAACAHGAARAPIPPTVTISVVGTNDLHGHVLTRDGVRGGVALLGGYLANLRRARAASGGGVLLIDAGDLFQGTMESNLNEGAAVIAAYNLLGYDAAAIGNHEFDYGVVGPRTNPRPGEDARGALRARAAEARFPVLTANIIDSATGQPLAGKNIFTSTMREVAGVKVGIVGVSTIETPYTTSVVTFRGLEMAPLAATIDAETRKLRAAGAELVVVAAHAGLCSKVVDSDEVQRCSDGEIVDVVKAMREPVDVVIGGHTHSGSVYQVGETPILCAWKYGTGFGRVDLVYDRARHAKVGADVRGLQLLVPGDYEGAPVVPDVRVAAALEPYVAAAAARRDEKLGVRVTVPVLKRYGAESALGNLVTDMMRVARPGADIAITNGGGLRADLPAGELSYGQVYEALPFDNQFATVRMTGAELRGLLAHNVSTDRGFLSISGLRARAACESQTLAVSLVREDGRPVRDDETLTVLTSDFLATGGMEKAIQADPTRITLDATGESMRDGVALALKKRGGTLDGKDPAIFDPAHRRIDYPGQRPVRCP